jgi:hypothetical protein
VLPDDRAQGWLGADSDVSLVISGGKTGKRALWVFADTYIATYNKAQNQREWEKMEMPHSTVALVECAPSAAAAAGERQCAGKPEYHWRKGVDGSAQTFWQLPPSPDDAGLEPLLWPVAGLASRDGKMVVLLAQEILGGLNVVGTTAIVVDVTADEAEKWPYVTTAVPSRNSTLNWFSAITWANPTDRTDTQVYLFGHDTTMSGRQTILARGDFAQLVQHDWSGLSFWQHDGWSSTYSTAKMKPLNVPSWETTCRWSDELQLFYTFNNGGGNKISLWTAAAVTDEWTSTAVYSLPGPFSGEARNGSWLCYAAKSHPELAKQSAAAATDVELVFSWICNTWGNATITQAQEFQPGGMSLQASTAYPEGIRGYWFRFIRVAATKATVITAPSQNSVKTDDITVSAPLADYTSSRLRLPSSRVSSTAIDTRLRAVREAHMVAGGSPARGMAAVWPLLLSLLLASAPLSARAEACGGKPGGLCRVDGPKTKVDTAAWMVNMTVDRQSTQQKLNWTTVSKAHDNPALFWSRSAYIAPQVHTFDRFLFNRSTNKWTVQHFLQDLNSRYGSIDALLLWPTYPNLGADDRNQFDLFRALPGGLTALTEVTSELLSSNVSTLWAYLFWDTGTKREAKKDEQVVAELTRQTGARGINGDCE